MKWTESRVAHFEAGRVASPSLNTLLALVLPLADAACPEATLPRLVKFISPMQIDESLDLWDADIVNLLEGKRVTRAVDTDDVVLAPLGWRRTTRDRKISHSFSPKIGTVDKVAQA